MYKKQERLNVLIPNATSPKNIGDLAMLVSLVNLINKSIKDADITVHSSDPHLHSKKLVNKIDHTLYSWSVFEKRNFINRIMRLFLLISSYLQLKFKLTISVNTKLNSLIRDYQSADIIIFVGGGYLRSKKGLTQSLNLLMQLALLQYAKLFKAKKIVSPVSFGPFAYKWQERLSAKALNNLDIVAAREEYSYKLMKENKIGNLILSSDHALLLNNTFNQKTKKDWFVLGFTIRKWFNGKRQDRLENSYIKAFTQLSRKMKIIVQPIVQVNAPEYGDNDLAITEKLYRKLKLNKVDVYKIKIIKNLKNCLTIYSKIDLLLGMRMHSNILASTLGKPFVAVSYEHKTEGITRQLGIEDYSIKCNEIDENKLYDLLISAYKNRYYLQKRIVNSVKKIQISESDRWKSIIISNIN